MKKFVEREIIEAGRILKREGYRVTAHPHAFETFARGQREEQLAAAPAVPIAHYFKLLGARSAHMISIVARDPSGNDPALVGIEADISDLSASIVPSTSVTPVGVRTFIRKASSEPAPDYFKRANRPPAPHDQDHPPQCGR